MDLEIEKIRSNIRSKKQKPKESKRSSFTIHLSKFLFTVILTLVSLILIKKNTLFKEKFYKYVYEDSFSFATVRELYNKHFGSSIPLLDLFKDETKAVFNEKFMYTKTEPFLEGVKVDVTDKYLMPVLESGMIVFIGEKEGYGNTIIVQQMNGVDVWYSNVTSNVKLYDYIEKGDVLGEVNGNYLYLTFRKDGVSQNYEDYI